MQELEQIEKWRTTILECHEKCYALWDPNLLNEQTRTAESAARLFAATYAKDLLANGFPRQNGYFWDDMEKVVDVINKIVSEATVTQVAQDIKASSRKRHIPRLKHLTNEYVAGLYNNCAQKLIRRRLTNGEFEYEPQRGGHQTGQAEIGRCSLSTIKSWIAKYPDESKVHEHNGFHAGLLNNEDGLKKSVQQWRKYVEDYVQQFEEWRKTHATAKRSDFRFKKYTTIHCNG